MLAMVANDNAGSLIPRGVLGFIASMLAPTGLFVCSFVRLVGWGRFCQYSDDRSASGCLPSHAL
jgi:hypothetical protein